jgi:hypothetical protein
MSEVSVGQSKARSRLETAWGKIDTDLAPPASVGDRIREILLARDVTYKYILVTGLLGKLTNPKAHPRALQAGSDLPGAYDARSLCHKVIVPFEKGTGLNLFGLSNEPFVNKLARHPTHDKDNPQLKNRALAAAVHDVLESAHRAKPAAVEAMLVLALRIGRELARTHVVAAADLDTNLRHVLSFVQKFLQATNGGARLAAVTGAFLSLLSESYVVKVHQPTSADKFAETAGDIEVYVESKLYSAYECKHRPLNLDDIRHGIRKAREKGVLEYCFVTAEGLAKGQEKDVHRAVEEALDSLDVSVLDIVEAVKCWAVALNPVRGAQFGDRVATILRDDMRRHDTANAAADLWNSLE